MGKYVTVGPRSGELDTPDPRIKEVVLRLATYDGPLETDPTVLDVVRVIAKGETHRMLTPPEHETIHMWAAILGLTTSEFCRQAIVVLEGTGQY